MKALFIFLIICFEFLPTYAQQNYKADVSCKCDQSIDDPFEIPVQFNFGPYKDQCVDTCRFRAVQLMDKVRDLSLKADEQHWLVANILHKDKYWLGRIPINKVETISVAFENFAPNISHFFIRFHFAEDVRLFQQPISNHRKNETVRDLVFSADGVPPRGSKYEMFDAALGRYLLVHRFMTADETVKDMIIKKKHHIESFILDLNQTQRNEILRGGLLKSAKDSFIEIYNLVNKNCATSALDLVESHGQIKTDDFSIFRKFERGLPINFFYSTKSWLESLQILGAQVSYL